MAQALKTPQSMPVVGAVRIFVAAAVGPGPWKWFHLAKSVERLQGGRGQATGALISLGPVIWPELPGDVKPSMRRVVLGVDPAAKVADRTGGRAVGLFVYKG